MTITEISTRVWALASQRYSVGEGGGFVPLSGCTNHRSRPMDTLRKPVTDFIPKRQGTTRDCTSYPGWQLHISNHWFPEKNSALQHTPMWQGQSIPWPERDAQANSMTIYQLQQETARSLSRDRGTFPEGGRGTKWGQHSLYLHIRDSSVLQGPSSGLTLWHWDRTSADQPTRQTKSVDYHIPHVTSTISLSWWGQSRSETASSTKSAPHEAAAFASRSNSSASDPSHSTGTWRHSTPFLP